MGEALQTDLSRTRAITEGLFTPDLFAALLLRRPFDALRADEAPYVRWAVDEAVRWDRSGRAPTTARALAFLFAYSALRDRAKEAEHVPIPPRAPRWERVLTAACNLRHRQRAVVALRYCAALDDGEIAAVVGVRPAEVPGIVERGVASIAAALGERVDVRRGLRMAAGRLRARLDADGDRTRWDRPLYPLETAPGRDEPREVIRAWVTAPVRNELSLRRRLAASSSRPPVIPKGSPVFTLLRGDLGGAPTPRTPRVVDPASGARPVPRTAPTPTQPHPRPAVARARTTGSWRSALAVAAAMVLVGIVLPVSAGDADRPSATGPLPPTVQAIAGSQADVPDVSVSVAGRRAVRVTRGDTLWALARDAYRDPARWVDIWRANRGRAMPGGDRFTDPNLIKPGWRLRIPLARR